MKAIYPIVLTFAAALAACQPHPPQPLNVSRTPTPTTANNAPKTPESNGGISTNTNSGVVSNKNQSVEPAPTPKSAISPNVNSTALKPKFKNYTVNGIVKAIDIEKSLITIDHEDIGDYMVAMEMPFPVVNKDLLKSLKTGDKVEFVLETDVGVERIIKIRKK